jgi:hypothetical protein
MRFVGNVYFDSLCLTGFAPIHAAMVKCSQPVMKMITLVATLMCHTGIAAATPTKARAGEM